MHFPSKLIENAVSEISKLPGIGKKTALRLVLHILKQPKNYTFGLSEALNDLREKTTYCTSCHNVADSLLCDICTSHRRDRSVICVVEDLPDLMALENTGHYQGLYHVLGGVISPMEGIGPDDLKIESLIERVRNQEEKVQELIFAINPTMEGDTTCFYLTKKMAGLDLKITSIARGVPIGGELEYTDEITLGRSLTTRREFKL